MYNYLYLSILSQFTDLSLYRLSSIQLYLYTYTQIYIFKSISCLVTSVQYLYQNVYPHVCLFLCNLGKFTYSYILYFQSHQQLTQGRKGERKGVRWVDIARPRNLPPDCQ